MSSSLDILDPDLALERAGGNHDLARELYQMLQNELPNYRDNILQHFEADNVPVLLDVVHKLNGSATYCGVPALKGAAADLESAIKQEKHSEFEGGVKRVIAEIEQLQQHPEIEF